MASTNNTTVVMTPTSLRDTTTRPFKSAFSLQTAKPVARSVWHPRQFGVGSTASESDPTDPPDHNNNNNNNTVVAPTAIQDASEARYWYEKFDWGHTGRASAGGGGRAPYAHARRARLATASSVPVYGLHFAPSPEADRTASTQNHHKKVQVQPLAVATGPRVQLYGTTPLSSLHQTLQSSQKSTTTTTTTTPSSPWPLINADRQVPTGGQLALTVQVRHDGRLLVCGTLSGQIRVADLVSRVPLCTWSTPTAWPIRSVQWLRDGQHVLAAGDDGRLTLWSLAASVGASLSSKNNNNATRPSWTGRGHGDAIRCARLWQTSAVPTTLPKSSATSAASSPYHGVTWVATASYDHTIRLWDLTALLASRKNDPAGGGQPKEEEEEEDADQERASADCCRLVLPHGAPVEAVEWMPSTNKSESVPVWLVSAGGTTLKVWNPVTGQCVQTLRAHHRKTMTCLLAMPRVILTPPASEDPSSQPAAPTRTSHLRLLTGGLDGLVRVHAWDSRRGQLRHLHGFYVYDESSSSSAGPPPLVPITSMAATTTGDRMALGTVDGQVLVRQRGPSISPQKRTREPRAGTYAFFTRGMNADPVSGDYVVLSNSNNSKKRKVRSFDVALKQFRYGDALDQALETRIPQVVVAVLEELGKRRGLSIALSNRDEETLEPILAFLHRYITRPRFAALLIGVAHALLDIYGSVAGQSETIDELLAKLRHQVQAECRTQRALWRVVGQLDALLTAAETNGDGNGLVS